MAYKKIELDLDVFHPVNVLQAIEAEELFGKMYKYDLPKWCAENGYRCFYKPETLVYVIIPKSLREL